MPYLKTILTYHLPSEAEVDKSLLESHGIDVNLLNAHTTRNELGAPFHIQLQVPAERVEEAVAVLREFNPQRFGSADRVREIERDLRRMVFRIGGAVIVAAVAMFFLTSDNPLEGRITASVLGGLFFGLLGVVIYTLGRKKN